MEEVRQGLKVLKVLKDTLVHKEPQEHRVIQVLKVLKVVEGQQVLQVM